VTSSMVSVWGKTYRIESVTGGTYDAVRLLDDARIGSFGGAPLFSLNWPVGGEALIRQIAQTAIRAAKTLWTPSPSHKLA